MINLIPMAGEGKRFADEGYTLPKPLVPVTGVPMIIRASQSLPLATKSVYVCRLEHMKDYQIEKTIREYYPNSEFVTTPGLTEGQASTCLLAKKIIDPNEALMIGASDNGMIWDKEKFEQKTSDYDVLIWTFRGNPTVVHKPKQYGWVDVDTKNSVKRVSVKVPISSDPIHDHAVVGAFWFKKAQYFFDAAEKMIAENRRVNNEFYVDEAINSAIELSLRVGFFEIDKYICWGTPNDLRTFDYWESFFNGQKFHKYKRPSDV